MGNGETVFTEGHAPSAIEAFYRVLSTGRFDYADEAVCQQQIETFLYGLQIQFEREYRLVSTRGFLDFYLPRSQLALEVKAGKQWSKRAVYRQCERYCADPEVQGLILATGKIQGMPKTIYGKPIKVLQLGRGFL